MALRPIGQDELDYFQFDESGRLHWNGEAVLLEKRIRLETYQIALASLATAGSLLSGIHPLAILLDGGRLASAPLGFSVWKK